MTRPFGSLVAAIVGGASVALALSACDSPSSSSGVPGDVHVGIDAADGMDTTGPGHDVPADGVSSDARMDATPEASGDGDLPLQDPGGADGADGDAGPPSDADVTVADPGLADADAAVIDPGGADGIGDVPPDLPSVEADTSHTPTVAEYHEPEPVTAGNWVVAVFSLYQTYDPVWDDLEAGTFTYPGAGTDADGILWTAVELDDSGGMDDPGASLIYLTAEVPVPEGHRLFARAERSFSVFGNGVRQPGDIYGSRKMRVPLASEPGIDPPATVVMMRALGGRGRPEIKLWTTPDELYLNTADLTAPHLVVDDASELYLGVPVLNLEDEPALDAVARVVESEHFEETALLYPALAGGAVTQVGWHLVPKAAFAEADLDVPVVVRVESASLDYWYEREITLKTIAPEAGYKRTFRSPVDASIQYYGVRPPRDFEPGKSYALVLSLHGAGVQAINQARSYGQKDWAYIVAGTNRRPFGFDWEEWGRLNAIATLDHASESFAIDPTRVYLTGHSMGGHGTWHVGVTTPGRFATIGPSAGWSSFYSYGGADPPTGPFARARAHSETNVYLENLARRGVYIIHGSADDNVPVSEGRNMFDAISLVTDDVIYHEEPGAGHWWDGAQGEGADCVDWPPLFEFMQSHTLDPLELEFTFRSPSPAYNPHHSYVTLGSALTPYQDCELHSELVDASLTLTTTNVRSLEIDGAALRGLGLAQITVDGDLHDLPDGPLSIGPAAGKQTRVNGPYNQVYHRPFCYVYPDAGDPGSGLMAEYAAFLLSDWSIYGNGHGCALPIGAVTPWHRESYNLVYLGLAPDAAGDPSAPFDWSPDAITFGGSTFDDGALLFVFPEGDRLSAVLYATAGSEYLLYRVVPFSSRAGLPDYLIWTDQGGAAAGYFAPDWSFDPALGVP